MSTTTITLDLPENLYLRLQQTAEATRQSLDAVLMRALQVGSPPTWETAPAEFQADLAALDRLDDAALWRIARARAAQHRWTATRCCSTRTRTRPSRPASGTN